MRHDEGLLSYSIEDILKAFHDHLNLKLQNYPNITKIFISSQMACFGLRNSSSKIFKNQIISWQSSPKDIDFLNRTMESYDRNGMHKRTGETFKEGSPYVLLNFLHHKKHDLDGEFTTVNSTILESLLGHRASLHVTDAAASGIYDLTSQNWIHDDTHLHGIKFPIITSDFPKQFKIKEKNFSIFEGVGDQQASLLGVEMTKDEVVINIGTGGQVATLVKNFVYKKDIQTRPFFDNCFINTITHLPSGRILTRAVLASTGNSSKNNFQYFNSLASKDGEPEDEYDDSIDELFTLLRNNCISNGEFAYRFVNHLSQKYVEAIKKIVVASELDWNKVVLKSAGGVPNALPKLIELIQAKLEKEIVRAKSEETTLSGLAKLSLRSDISD